MAIKVANQRKWWQTARKHYLPAYLMILPAFVFVTLLLGYGLIAAIFDSVHKVEILSPERPFVGLENYADLFANRYFRAALVRSLVFTVSSVVLGLVFSFIFALTLYHAKRWVGVLRTITLVPYLISGIAAAIIWRFLFSSTAGLVNATLYAIGIEPVSWFSNANNAMMVMILTNVWKIIPFSILILLAGLQSIDREVYDAAAVDGANRLQSFRHVTIPLLGPMIAISLIWLTFATFNMFDIILPLTGGGPRRGTEVLALYMYQVAFQQLNFSTGAAVMLILVSINLVMSLVYIRIFRV
jgi:ABC-type sugar transport system permease subunit